MKIHLNVFDGLLGQRTGTKRFLVDAREEQGGWAVVVRGQDEAYVGQTNDVGRCTYVWNDEAGIHRPWVVASGGSEEQARAVVQDLLAFFGTYAPLGDRVAIVRTDAARQLLPVLIAVFGPVPFAKSPGQAKCHRWAGSYDQDVRGALPGVDARRAAVRAELERMAAMATDPLERAGIEELLSSISS